MEKITMYYEILNLKISRGFYCIISTMNFFLKKVVNESCSTSINPETVHHLLYQLTLKTKCVNYGIREKTFRELKPSYKHCLFQALVHPCSQINCMLTTNELKISTSVVETFTHVSPFMQTIPQCALATINASHLLSFDPVLPQVTRD